MVKAIPEDYPRVSATLTVHGAKDAIAFYNEVFGMTTRMEPMMMPDGSVVHSELTLGDSLIMITDENKEFGNTSPKTVGGTPVTLMVYVEDVDATAKLAVERGATVTSEPRNEFYGDRVCGLTDPWGHSWFVATHVEDVSEEEMGKRMAEFMGG